jgi:hypothetical protein
MADVELHPSQPVSVVYISASVEGWGAHCTHHYAQGPWSEQEQNLHSNILELKAGFLAFKAFFKFIINIPVLVATDKTTAVAYINKQGGTHSWEPCMVLWCILTWIHQNGCLNVTTDKSFIQNSHCILRFSRKFVSYMAHP